VKKSPGRTSKRKAKGAPGASKQGRSGRKNVVLNPAPPGAGKHKDVRYLDIREGDALDEAQLASWFEQAAALPGWLAA
jgi:hypothetical protein